MNKAFIVAKEPFLKKFGGRVRVRVCGLLNVDNQILLIGHKSLQGDQGVLFWSPPGGEVNFLENLESALVREFKEEVGIDIWVFQFLGIYEYIKYPLHAIEIFFEVIPKNVIEPRLGSDPELSKNNQIIQEVSFFTLKEIQEKQSHKWFHPIVKSIKLKSDHFIPFIYHKTS